ncbi:putative micrococcal nuclease [Dioscorea sansibarensis]
MMDGTAKKRSKDAELHAKKNHVKMWTNFIPVPANSKAIHGQSFTGTVVEVVSGDCIIVADDAVPYGSPQAERCVNLSSIRAPRLGHRDEN